MKKLTIPAILAFWLVIIVAGVLVMNRRDPPPPPPRESPTPANVSVVQEGRGARSVVISTESGEDIEFLRPDDGDLEYLGPVASTPYHMVSTSPSRGQVWTTVVDERTGGSVRLAGTAVSSANNGWIAAAGSSADGGYSWIDVVELAADGLQQAVHLDALRHGLWAESASWTKSGDLVVQATRGYQGLCEAPVSVELLLDRDSTGSWTPWLDDARSVTVTPDGVPAVRRQGDEVVPVAGRFLGSQGDGTTRADFFDPDWTAVEDPQEAVGPQRVVVLTSGERTFDAWPIFPPDTGGSAVAVGALPCTFPPNREAIRLYPRAEGADEPVATFDPVEFGWSSGAVVWQSADSFTVPGWVEGGVRSPEPGVWVPTRTGVFLQPDPALEGAPGGILEPVPDLTLVLDSDRTATLPSAEAPQGPYRYLGYSPDLRAHLVHAGIGSSGGFVLIDDVNARAWPLNGVPIPADSGLRFATAREDGLGNYDVAVYEWSSSGGAARTWLGSVPVSDVDSIFWDGDDRLRMSASQAVSIRKGADGEWRRRGR